MPRAVVLLIAVALIVISFRLISAYSVIGFGPAKYYNVTVNGISLEGYSKSAARELFQELEQAWADASYTLTYEDHAWTFTASTFDARLDIDTQLELAWNLGHYGSLSARRETILSLRENPRAFTSALTYDEKKLADFIAGIQAVTDVAPVDAEIVLDIEAPRIVTDSKDGAALDVDGTRELIMNLLLTGQGETALVVNVVTPQVSSDEASGGLAVIAHYSTDISRSTSDRKTNVAKALSYYNAREVRDGEIVSFNTIVGERTKARGFKEALEYEGNTVVMGIGGGSCQASTTLYVAAMMAGMDIVERHPHNMTVAYASPSLDATVSWPKKDFVFQNNTGHTVYIYTKVTDKKAHVVVYGNLPEYKIEFRSVVTKKGIEATSKQYREDVSGQYAYYTDDEYLIEQGKDGCESQGWLIYYDWTSGQEVSREMVSQDAYSPGTSIYWKGVHDRVPTVTLNPNADY